MRYLIVAAALWGSTGCLRKTLYKCSDSTQCGANGQCEDTGFCSFPDTKCDSGRSYGEYSAQEYAGQCVGSITNPDIDAAPGDGMVDASPDSTTPVGCPGTYGTTIGTHKYRVLNNSNWATAKNACAADGSNAYLAIPDDKTELDAIVSASGAALTWVGINDPADNNMFVTVKGVSFSSTSALWASGEPDNQPTGGNQNGNCAQADSGTTNLLDDEDCLKSRKAVCECEP